MSGNLALVNTSQLGAIEQVLVQGDLSKLNEQQRVSYYNEICRSLGLNPLTQPFQYIVLNGKLRLYATKDATEQLRKIHGVSIERVDKERVDDLYVVTAYAKDATGRTDAGTGAVVVGNLKGEALANALMKCETKAKRRVTLSICGLGMLDETETETIPSAKPAPPAVIDVQTGEEVKALPAAAPEGYDEWLTDLDAVAAEGMDKLRETWRQSSKERRDHVMAQEPARWEAIKAKAGRVK